MVIITLMNKKYENSDIGMPCPYKKTQFFFPRFLENNMMNVRGIVERGEGVYYKL